MPLAHIIFELLDNPTWVFSFFFPYCCCSVAKSGPTLATPWAVDCQAPPFRGFPRQEYWSRLPFPSPGDLPDPGTEPKSPALHLG